MLDIVIGIVKIMNIAYTNKHYVHYTPVFQGVQWESSRSDGFKSR